MRKNKFELVSQKMALVQQDRGYSVWQAWGQIHLIDKKIHTKD